MILTKYIKILIITSMFALAFNALGVWYEQDVTISYAKDKKEDTKVYKRFADVGEGSAYNYKGEARCYVDKKNDKLYIEVEDFFESLAGTGGEAKIKVNAIKRNVEVKRGKKYVEDYKKYNRAMEFPKSIKGKPENIKFNIDGKNISIKGYVLKVNVEEIDFDQYRREIWKKYTTSIIFVDFDDIAGKLDLIYDKDIVKSKFLLYTKLPKNVIELKTGKSPIESYDFNNNISVDDISSYDIDERWANTIGNYLYEENGGLVRIENKKNEKNTKKSKTIASRYDKKGNLISRKEIIYQGEKFGGFFRGEEYNYLIFGNDNKEQNDKKEVIRIIKYDRDFNELGKLPIFGAFTKEPFGAGSLRCGEIGNVILVHTARGRFDGHQSSLTIGFNEDSMTILNGDDLGAFQRNHVSHSFNQFVMTEGDEFITVDHGDAYPRNILVTWLATQVLEPIADMINGNYAVIERKMFSPIKKKAILEIPGMVGANQTGVSIGSTVNMSTKVLVGVNRVDYSKVKSFNSYTIKGKDVYKRDIVLYTLDKNTLEVTENKYTDYTKDKNTTYTAPKMVKLDDTRVMLIWNKLNITWEKYNDKIVVKNPKDSVLQYMIVDENGNKLSDIKTVKDMILTDEAPILFDGKVVWTQYKSGRLVLNSIPLE